MDKKNRLIQEAIKAAKCAYAAYSNYPVGAALLTMTGKVYIGSNVENASYSLTSCAERNAVFKAIIDGEKKWDLIALATRDGGFPCGACRQVMYEFNPDLLVIVANLEGEIIHEITVSDLLPYAFGPGNLK